MGSNSHLPHLTPDSPGNKTTAAPKLWTKDFISVCTLNLFVFGAFQMLQPTMPLYIRHLGGSDLLAGLSTSVLAMAAIIVRPFAGWALDNKGRRLITIGGVFFFASVFILYSLTRVIGIILILRCIHGLAFSFSSSATGTVAADIVPRNRFAQGMSILGVTSNMAMAIAPAIGLWIIKDFDYNYLFFTCFILAIIAIAVSAKMKYPEVNTVKKQNKIDLWGIINKKSIPPSIVMALCSTTYSAITTFVAIYAQEKSINGGVFFTFMAISTAVSRLAMGSVVDKKGCDIVLYWGIGIFMLSPLTLFFANSQALIIVSAIFFGIGFGFILPSLQTIAVRSAKPNNRGAATSTYYLAFDLGMVLGGIISGWLSELIGFEKMFLSMLLPVIVAAFIFKRICANKSELQAG